MLRSRGETDEARAALSELCEIYYRPVFAFLKTYCGDEEQAREIAHEFFERLLEKGGFEGVDPARGKFRSYLLGALKHFVHEKRKFENRQKRGAGVLFQSIEEPLSGKDEEMRMEIANTFDPHFELYFDREWALTIVMRALTQVEDKYRADGKSNYFEVLKPWLAGTDAGLNQKSAAEKLGISESAVKVAIHRLRKKFRDAVKSEIAQTVREESQINEELNYLIQVLSNQ